MKKIIIAIIALISVNLSAFSQNDINVENQVNTSYVITAKYTDGNSFTDYYYSIEEYDNQKIIPYEHPDTQNYSHFYLTNLTIASFSCSGSPEAYFDYDTSGTDYVNDCGQCGTGAVAIYDQSGGTLTIECY